MDSCRKKDIYCDSKDTLVGVEETWEDTIPSRRNMSYSYMRWLIVTVLIGFMVMFSMVVWQQTQINTMQLELDELLQDRIDQLEHNYDLLMEEELKNNENETDEAISSRQRRQAGNRQSSQIFTPFAHLVRQPGSWPRANLPYQWSRPASSHNSMSTASYYSNVQLHPSTGSTNVQAIQVSCSGWFYVYAQLPYEYHSGTLLGHKIVKLGNCGNVNAVPILSTMVQLPVNSNGPSSNKANWKYLGGIVHLAAGDRVQVEPNEDMHEGSDWLNDLSRTGGFFGLYQIQQAHPLSCRSC